MGKTRADNQARYRIDSTPWSAVVCCQMCSWRGAATGKRGAYRLIADHLEFAHDAYRAAGDARISARRHFTHAEQSRSDSDREAV